MIRGYLCSRGSCSLQTKGLLMNQWQKSQAMFERAKQSLRPAALVAMYGCWRSRFPCF